MTSAKSQFHFPVAIGGVGGSGTRLGSMLLQELGFYLGDDLNDCQDNLWFTLLFKRHEVLTLSDARFRELANLFSARMIGGRRLNSYQWSSVLALAAEERTHHDRSWLAARAATFLRPGAPGAAGRPWGWKEPNTHLVIERLFGAISGLRYIQFVRHPLDMAFSANQSQLAHWGPVILKRDVEITPRASLTYWCEVHRRSTAILQRHPDQTMTVDFDELCANPVAGARKVAAFLGAELPDGVAASYQRYVQPGVAGSGRFRRMDLRQFDPADMAYVASLGYDVTLGERIT